MPISRWKTTSTHDATWSLRLWICALVVPFSGQKRLISPVGSSLIIQYPCADYTRGVVSLYGERTPGVLIPYWKMTPTRHVIRSHRWWMYAFAMSFSGRKGESFRNVKYLRLGSSHEMRYLSADYKRGAYHNMMNKLLLFFFHVVQWLTHTLIWRVILLHNERTTVGSSYLTLKIDSYTTWNMSSSIVNVHICFTILLAKRQSSVKTVYLKKYIVGSPLIMWLDEHGCICTYYLMALLNLRKGSHFIISGNNSPSAYRTLQNESHTLTGELFYGV